MTECTEFDVSDEKFAEIFEEVYCKGKTGSGWTRIEDGLPEAAKGDYLEVIVNVYRGHSDKCYSFAANYLNGYMLYDEYEDKLRAYSGWYELKQHADYDEWFTPLELSDGDKITAWQYLPKPLEK